MKKIIPILLFTLLLTACTGEKTESNSINTAIGKIGQNEPIKRSQAAKMLALSAYDIDTIENMPRTIVFEDTDVSKPYDKYINAAFKAGLISGADESHFEPDSYLSLEQSQFLLNKLDKSGTLKLQFNHDDRKKPISSAMWTEVFERAVKLNGSQITSVNIIPYADGNTCSELGDRFIMTDRGLLSDECCLSTDYTDCTVIVLLRDKEILAYKEVVNTEPSVAGAVVVSVDGEGVGVDMGGVERYFYTDRASTLNAGDSIGFKYEGSQITELDGGLSTADGVSLTEG